MQVPEVGSKRITDIKSKLLRPSLTSQYYVHIQPPTGTVNPFTTFLAGKGLNIGNKIVDSVNLACTEASLPGSSLALIDIENDYHGVSEKNAYRRMYDNDIALTFYVTAEEYYSVRFFESWMSFIVNEDDARSLRNSNYSYRVKYSEEYKSQMSIVKIERDYGLTSGNGLQYDFIDVFPRSINSMPVSYGPSQLLKVTVNFSYLSYVLDFKKLTNPTQISNEFNAAAPPPPKAFVTSVTPRRTSSNSSTPSDLIARTRSTAVTETRSAGPTSGFGFTLSTVT